MDSKQELREMIGEVETYGRAAAKSMADLSRAVLLAGIGTVGLVLDEAMIFVDKLADRGEMAERNARQAVESAVGRSKKQAEQVRNDTEQQVVDVLGRMGLPSRSDIAELDLKLAALTAKIDELGTRRRMPRTYKAPPPATPATPAQSE